MTVALVTGAGKRLGRSMATYLAQRGFDVAIHYASSDAHAQSLVDEIQALGRKSVAFQADLLSEAETQALFPKVSASFDAPVTCLVNNASIFEHDRLETATRESWDRHFESNLRAPFVLTQAMAAQVPTPIDDEAGEPVAQGVVVNMIDQRVRKLTPEFMSYTLAKMGLWAFTQTAAQGLAPRVRVNAIGPGPTLRGGRQSETHFKGQRAATVLRRGSNPSDVNAALGFFLDSPAVTGQLICTDGGQHLGWQTPDVMGVEE
ncbi:SDR family oxidoreductase [Thalassovita sp.]|uniref:SDR family oxidoreductase n=1 Tax=Thalassovita sp. TaxID=1979401 RepID=UPI002B279E1A|nr:SDR family oxidoreductase [Thalassovita sp.]